MSPASYSRGRTEWAPKVPKGPRLPSPKAAAAKVKKTADGKQDKDAWKKFFDKRVVVTGLSDNARVEIIKGLKLGDEVALEDPTLPADKKKDDNDD